MKKIFNKVLASVVTVALVAATFVGVSSTTKAADTVAIKGWTFSQGGQYNPGEPGNEGYINSVKINGTNETIGGWLTGTGSVNQTQSATQAGGTGFFIDIANTGWDAQWRAVTGYETDRINPWSVQAMMSDVPITPGHIYTVSFKAKASKKKYAYVTFGSTVNDIPPYSEASLEEGSDGQIITLGTTEQTFTYKFTNWASAASFTTRFMLGAFDAQYDYAGNDVSDIITERETNWSGTVTVSDFTITDEGMNSDFEVIPPVVEDTISSWDWFSVCDGRVTNRPTTAWENTLMSIGWTYGIDYATAGYLTQRDSSSCNLYVVNSGWDGSYNNGELSDDNPYGLQILYNNINVEKNRYYTATFNIKSTLKTSLTVYRDSNNDYYTSNGTFYRDSGKENTSDDIEAGDEFNKTESQVMDLVKDGTLTEDTKKVTTKKVLLKAISLSDDSSLEFSDESTGCYSDGSIILDSSNEKATTVKAIIKVPYSYEGDSLRLVFNCGAFLYTRPYELGMKGNISISDFNIEAGEQIHVPDEEWTVIKEPKCKETGLKVKYCSDCEEILETEVIEELGHSFTNYISNNDAGLCTDGTKTSKCDRCDETDTVTDEGTGVHDIRLEHEIKATCKKNGYSGDKVCSVCGKIFEKGHVIEDGDHVFENYVSNDDATCTQDGTKTRKCSECELSETVIDEGSAKGHTVFIDKAALPTCTSKGLTEGSHCSECNEILMKQEYVPMLVHKIIVKNAIASSFFNPGYTGDSVCSLCGTIIKKGSSIEKQKLSKPTLKVKVQKKKVKILIGKVNGANKYEIKYKQGSKWKTKVVSKTSYTITKLKSKKKVTVQIRAMAISGSKKVFSLPVKKTVKVK